MECFFKRQNCHCFEFTKIHYFKYGNNASQKILDCWIQKNNQIFAMTSHLLDTRKLCKDKGETFEKKLLR